MLFLDAASARHQIGINPLICRSQASSRRRREGARRCGRWGALLPERRAVPIILCKLTCHIGHKSCKFVGISDCKVISMLVDMALILYFISRCEFFTISFISSFDVF
jgi:hypothetical protein